MAAKEDQVRLRTTENGAPGQDLSSVDSLNLRQILDASPQGYIAHCQLKPIYVNRTLADIFGYSDPDSILALDSILDLYAASERDRLVDYFDNRLHRATQSMAQEFVGLRRDGSPVWLENSVTSFDLDGRLAFLINVTNIEHRRLTEDLLRDSEQRFRDYAETATDWLWEMDADLRWTYFSGRMSEATGMAEDVFIGRTRRELLEAGDTVIGPTASEEDWDRHLADLEGHRPFRNFRHTRILPDGSRRHISLSGKPVWDDNGVFIGYRGIGTDVTEQVESELALREREAELREHRDRAEQANQVKSKFMANVSHELRTPLNAILGFSEIMRQQTGTSAGMDRFRDYAANIHESAGHLLQLITDILDISTIDANEHRFANQDIHLPDLVTECVDNFATRADEQGVTVETDLPADLPPLHADRGSIAKILHHLMSNATKYSSEGDTVRISADADSDWISIFVRDSGAGIAPADLPKLTDPFERGKRDPYRSEDGTGLGLAITHSLVMVHSGQLEFESELGAGTCVTVRLPAKPER